MESQLKVLWRYNALIMEKHAYFILNNNHIHEQLYLIIFQGVTMVHVQNMLLTLA